ncbi:hypothetical protein [Fulvivirga imtechensis]|nr:hypothetical protein [Fulvivirga imtechensis]
MTERIRRVLLKHARVNSTITYSDLNQKCELGLNFELGQDRDYIGELLGEISEYEHSKGRPLLSAMVLHKSKDLDQGDGFYKLCERLGFGNAYELKADRRFEKLQRDKVYEFWNDESNFNKYKDDYA